MHYKGLQGILGTDENGLNCVGGLTGVLLLLFGRSVVSTSFATPWPVVCQAPLSRGFPRREYWSGLPFPSPGDLPDSGIEPPSLLSPARAGGFFTTSATWETLALVRGVFKVKFLGTLGNV